MDDLALAVRAAEVGAGVVRSHFGEVRGADLKGRNNPVTEADRASETAIVSLLRTERPDDGVLAEEGSGAATRGRRWIVDPLDGTVNFVHGIPQIGVSVALYDGPTPLVGVIVDPFRHETFAAEHSRGATLNGSPIRCSDTDELRSAVVATGFPYDHDRHADAYVRPVGAMLAEVNGIRRLGSAALDLAWVAAGRFDGFWELGLEAWDVAAGILIVREAGGVITDPHGAPSTPDMRLVVAANRALHESIRTIVATHLPAHLS